MFCSNCGAEVFGSYCANCGAKTESPKFASENRAQQTAHLNSAKTQPNPIILLKSINCEATLNESEKKATKSLTLVSNVTSACMFILIFFPYIMGLLDGRKLKYIEPWPIPVMLLIFALSLVFFYYTVKQQKKVKGIANKYLNYCSKETLIVDEQKIYGSTSQSSIDLTYSQIQNISFSTHTPDSNNFIADPLCDILTIHDTSGRQYIFYSFANCKELKSVIDMQLKNSSLKTTMPVSDQFAAPSPASAQKQNTPIQPQPTEDGECICPICGQKQPVNRKVCWKCEQKFSNE